MIQIFNRKTKHYEEEKYLEINILNGAMNHPLGKILQKLLIKRKIISSIYGFIVIEL